MTANVLGMGLDPLTLAATILTVVVIDGETFDEMFRDIVICNDEGELVGIDDAACEGVAFTRESVDRLLEYEPMASPGAACLALAWGIESN